MIVSITCRHGTDMNISLKQVAQLYKYYPSSLEINRGA